jgi:hypothetical protein
MTEIDTMPKRTVQVKTKEYADYIRELDYSSGGIKAKETFWVFPDRVYRGGAGRQSIEFEHDGEKRQLHNHPGAGSFDLYKRVS